MSAIRTIARDKRFAMGQCQQTTWVGARLMQVLARAVIALGLVTTAASAETLTFSGITTGRPTWNRPIGAGPSLSGSCTSCSFQSFGITITDPSAFDAEILTARFDTYLHLYLGAFDPDAPLLNLVAGDDDDGAGLFSRITAGNDGPLVAGPHVIVVSGFDNDEFGSFTLQIESAFEGFATAGQQAASAISDVSFGADAARTGFLGQAAASSFGARSAAGGAAGRAAVAGQAAEVTETGAGRLAGNWHLWAEIGGYRTEREATGSSTSIGHTQIGLDFALDDEIVLGLAGGAGVITSDGVGALEGQTFWIQPYAGFDFGFLRGVVAVSVAFNDYDDFTLPAGTGDASGETVAGHVFLAHDIDAGYGLAISPYLTASFGRERIDEFGGGLAGTGDVSVRYFDGALGAELRQDFAEGFGATEMEGHAFLRFELQYRTTDAPAVTFGTARFDQTQLGFGIATGAQMLVADGVSAGFTAQVDGLGSDVLGFGGTARVDMAF